MPLARGATGLAKITTHKDRPGWLPRPKAAELALSSDPDTHAITWEFRPAAGDPDQTFRPTVLMERVSAYVAACNGELPSRNSIEENVKGKRDYVRRAVDVLLVEGYLSERSGARGARLLESVKPYRETEDDAA